ncbi:MAG TPA: hypothetical protein VM939_02340 [Gemmatimonadaceae bacterium]|nr:hypothetical protein [Gemmatimonadaceae bacterium]
MSDQSRFPNSAGRNPATRDALDERVVGFMRDAYQPPVSAAESTAYWTQMESRIMSRLATAGLAAPETRWWSVLGGWAQAGLVAAAVIFALAGVINTRLGNGDTQFAYDSVMPEPTESLSIPAELILTSDRSAENDAAVTYILSH